MSKMRQLPIGFPEEVREWIKKEADKRFLPEAGFVRQLVVEAMQKEKAVKEKQQREQEKK